MSYKVGYWKKWYRSKLGYVAWALREDGQWDFLNPLGVVVIAKECPIK